MDVIAIILGVVKLIPTLDSWFEKLTTAYFNLKIREMRAENVEAIRRLIEDRDQRDVEKAIGNSRPGEPSGDDGAVERDDDPGRL